MGYSKSDFHELETALTSALINENDEPLSCQLHDHLGATGRLLFISESGKEIGSHVAEACNIADIISSIERLFKLPRSNIACEELSEILLLRLDVLREYISSSFKSTFPDRYTESEHDKIIRRWAGFLKHPCDYVFAHRCLSDLNIEFDEPPIIIDTQFLVGWDKLNGPEKDKEKSKLAHKVVSVDLPSVNEIKPFFNSSADHIKVLLKVSTLQ